MVWYTTPWKQMIDITFSIEGFVLAALYIIFFYFLINKINFETTGKKIFLKLPLFSFYAGLFLSFLRMIIIFIKTSSSIAVLFDLYALVSTLIIIFLGSIFFAALGLVLSFNIYFWKNTVWVPLLIFLLSFTQLNISDPEEIPLAIFGFMAFAIFVLFILFSAIKNWKQSKYFPAVIFTIILIVIFIFIFLIIRGFLI